MSATSQSVSKTLSSLLAHKDFAVEYRRSIEDPAAFWAAYTRRFQWSRSWDCVLDWDGVHHQWFVGGKRPSFWSS
jgi:hypothetical protein